MSEATATPNTTASTSPFYLAPPGLSIFINSGLRCREYPTLEMVYGFIESQMGVKLRKHVANTYSDEHTHYMNYIDRVVTPDNGPAHVQTTYRLPWHGLGRIQADASLTLSVFHRPTRHAFAAKEYLDWDMINAQPKLFYELAKKAGLPTRGLEEYCADPKQCRLDIAAHYQLKDIVSDDGVVLTAKEQAKKLPLRIAFGGSVTKWKEDYNVGHMEDMPLVRNLQTTISAICRVIREVNPHIAAKLSTNADWAAKTEDEKSRSVMALYIQTWERIIQEHCIAHAVRTINSLQLADIVPSQDGFMPLKRQLAGVDVEKLLQEFNRVVIRDFGISIEWAQKPFDEAIEIPLCMTMPIHITLEHLNGGERIITDKIKPALKNQLVYCRASEIWYWLDSKNMWIKSKHGCDYLVTKTIQDAVEAEKRRVLAALSKADNESQKELSKELKELCQHFSKVGKSGYIKQVRDYLKSEMGVADFSKTLNKTAGKMVFANGILNLKTGEFQTGYLPTDFISMSLSQNYKHGVFDQDKMNFLRLQFKKILNNCDEHLEYFLSTIGHSFTGDASLEKAIYYIVDGTDNSAGDNGKTFIFNLLLHAFPEYVKQTNPTFLEESNTKTHKQLAMCSFIRLLFADEGTKKTLNASLMKKIGDGGMQENEVLFGYVTYIDVMFKMFVCSNHIPIIKKDEGAVFNRYTQIQCGSHFDRTGKLKEDRPDELKFVADIHLSEKLKADYLDEIQALICGYAMRYYTHGMPVIPTKFAEAAKVTELSNNTFATALFDVFEASESGKVSLDDVEAQCSSGLSRKDILKEMKKLGFEYDKNLKGLGDKINKDGKKVYVQGGFTGLSKIAVEVLEEELVDAKSS